MEHVFSDLIGNGVYIYIDDILIYGDTIEEHLHLYEEVLRRCRR